MDGFWIGALSGSVAMTILHPIDTVKSRSQIYGEMTKNRKMSVSIGYDIFKNEGLSGLYRGLHYSLMRQSVYSSSRIGLFSYGTDKIKNTKYDNIYTKIGLGFSVGSISSFIAAPLDRLLVRNQLSIENENKGTRYGSINIRNLWKNSSITVLRASVLNSVSLTTNNLINTYYNTDFEWRIRLIASTIAGISAATVSLPFDIVKTRLLTNNNDKYNGTFDCVKKIFKYEGLTAFYRGYPMYLTRVGTQSSIILFLSETLLEYNRKRERR